MTITAAIWDLDGTILDTEQLGVACWEEVCIAHGHTHNLRPTLHALIGRPSHDCERILRENFGDGFSMELLHGKKHELVEARLRRDGIPLKPGIRAVLQWLKDRGVPCAVASSTYKPMILDRLERAGLAEYFTEIVGGEEVERGKPHPDIFLLAARRLGKKPEECLVFEDSFNGVIAAHQAGMRVAMIPDLLQPEEDILRRVHHRLASLEEAIPLLSELIPPTRANS